MKLKTFFHLLGFKPRPKQYGHVIRTMEDGQSDTFATGSYVDEIVTAGDGPRLKRRTVVLDSRRIDTLLVVPL